MTLPLFPDQNYLVNGQTLSPDAVFNQPPDPALSNLPNVSYDLIQSIGNLRKLLPYNWFSDNDPVLDAILAGYADSINDIQVRNEWAYKQDRFDTATGIWLDMYAEEFFGVGGEFHDAGYMYRRLGEHDEPYRIRLRNELLAERASRSAMQTAITNWCGKPPTIIEPWNPIDTGVWDQPSVFWDQKGYWGSTDDPYTAFIIASRAGGVPLQTWNDETQLDFSNKTKGFFNGQVVSNTNYLYGGYDVGTIAWIDGAFNQSVVTDQMVYDCINRTKPVGTKAFVHLTDSQQLPNDPNAESFNLIDYNFILNTSIIGDANAQHNAENFNQALLGSTFLLGQSPLGQLLTTSEGPPPGYYNAYLDVSFVLNQGYIAQDLGNVSSAPPVFFPDPGFLAGSNTLNELPFVLGSSAPL